LLGEGVIESIWREWGGVWGWRFSDDVEREDVEITCVEASPPGGAIIRARLDQQLLPPWYLTLFQTGLLIAEPEAIRRFYELLGSS
jgi:hypothetical protein